MDYKWTVEIHIDPAWVADGFNLTAERMHAIMTGALPYAYGHEVGVRIVRAPSATRIAREQGRLVKA